MYKRQSLFLEAHPNPNQAKCDGPSALPLSALEGFVSQMKACLLYTSHFYLSICEKEQLDEPRIRGLVGSLVRKARQAIPEEWDDKAKIHQLLQLFYGDWGFHCDADNYFYARNLYLPYILEEREGMPVSLGALILYLAASLKLPIYPVNFPTQLILRAEVDGEVAFIDPWSGKYISVDELKKLYEGAFGFGAQIQPEDLLSLIHIF